SPRINLIPAVARGDGSVEVAGARIPAGADVPTGTRLIIGVRPEWLALDAHEPVSFTGCLPVIERLRSASVIHLRVPGLDERRHVGARDGRLIVRAPRERPAGLDIGDNAQASMRTAHLILFDESGKRLRQRSEHPSRVRAEAAL